MIQTYPRTILYRSILLTLLLLFFAWLMSGCKDDDEVMHYHICVPALANVPVTDIVGVPEHVNIDKIVVDVKGECWEIISSIEIPCVDRKIVLELPETFSDKLQIVDWSDKDVCGYWPTESTDPQAFVATLGDIIAYSGGVAVGRIYLTNWLGEGASANKGFVYFQYADRTFSLSGYNIPLMGNGTMFKPSFRYDATFQQGWNAYANINPSNPGETSEVALCTTSLPDDLYWRFESWGN